MFTSSMANLHQGLNYRPGRFAYFYACTLTIVCDRSESKCPLLTGLRSFALQVGSTTQKHFYNFFDPHAAAHNNGVFPCSSRHSTLWPHSVLNSHLIQSISSFRMESNTCLESCHHSKCASPRDAFAYFCSSCSMSSAYSL